MRVVECLHYVDWGEINMFRIWGKIWKDNHLLKDSVYEEDCEDTRTHKIFRGVQNLANEFDLECPIWLEANIDEFKKHNKTRFTRECFIEEVDFDYLEIQILQE